MSRVESFRRPQGGLRRQAEDCSRLDLGVLCWRLEANPIEVPAEGMDIRVVAKLDGTCLVNYFEIQVPVIPQADAVTYYMFRRGGRRRGTCTGTGYTPARSQERRPANQGKLLLPSISLFKSLNLVMFRSVRRRDLLLPVVKYRLRAKTLTTKSETLLPVDLPYNNKQCRSRYRYIRRRFLLFSNYRYM